MHFNEDTIKGKWQEIKGDVQKAWGKLTDDEIEETKGNVKAMAGLVRQKYGNEKADFENKFEEIVSRYNRDKGDTAKDRADQPN